MKDGKRNENEQTVLRLRSATEMLNKEESRLVSAAESRSVSAAESRSVSAAESRSVSAAESRSVSAAEPYELPEGWNKKHEFSFGELASAVQKLHESSYSSAVKAVNRIATVRNYVIGFYIVEYETCYEMSII